MNTQTKLIARAGEPFVAGRSGSLSAQIVADVREALFEKRLKPGEPIGTEKDLAAQVEDESGSRHAFQGSTASASAVPAMRNGPNATEERSVALRAVYVEEINPPRDTSTFTTRSEFTAASCRSVAAERHTGSR